MSTEGLFSDLDAEVYLHPLTQVEAAEVRLALAVMIEALPEGDDARGRSRAALVSAAEKLERHWCAWCPLEVRDLSAVAHNAAVNYGTNRELKKMSQLRHTVEHYRPRLNAHFDAIKPRPL